MHIKHVYWDSQLFVRFLTRTSIYSENEFWATCHNISNFVRWMLTSSLKNPLQPYRSRAGWKRYVCMRKNQTCGASIGSGGKGMYRACEISSVGSCSEASGWGFESVPVLCDVPRQWNPSAGVLSKVLEHSLEQPRTRSHPDVTFLYRNILEHSISYVIIEV